MSHIDTRIDGKSSNYKPFLEKIEYWSVIQEQKLIFTLLSHLCLAFSSKLHLHVINSVLMCEKQLNSRLNRTKFYEIMKIIIFGVDFQINSHEFSLSPSLFLESWALLSRGDSTVFSCIKCVKKCAYERRQ